MRKKPRMMRKRAKMKKNKKSEVRFDSLSTLFSVEIILIRADFLV
jgi:hypothetical protein